MLRLSYRALSVSYTTNLPRAALAILVGTIVGAILVTLWSFWGNANFQYLREYWQRDALIVFTYAAFVWAAGLFVVAPGPWAMLHRNGFRGWWAAVGLGAILSFVVTLGLLTNAFGLIDSTISSAADGGGPTWVEGPHATRVGRGIRICSRVQRAWRAGGAGCLANRLSLGATCRIANANAAALPHPRVGLGSFASFRPCYADVRSTPTSRLGTSC
jgi:hypothetical protein